MFADRTNWNLKSNRLAEAVARFRASGEKLLDLTASNPTECGFHYDGAAILKALITPAVLRYNPDPRGLTPARKAVVEYYAQRGDAVGVEDLILTTSTSEAYSFVFRLLCNPGDEILVPKPSYPLFEFLADLQDVRLVPYPLLYDHGWQIDLPSLYSAVTSRTRGIVLVHPNNPTGSYTKSAEIEDLNHFCAANALALVVDEVFLDYPHDGVARSSLAMNSDALTFTLSGLSKIAGLPQMKVAWIVTS